MAPSETKPLIVHVVRQFLPNRGGLEDVVANLCGELARRDYRVRVVTLDRLFGDPGKKLPEDEIIDGIEVVRIPWRGSTRYPIAPSVFKHLSDADLIHVHAIDFFYDALAWGWLLHRKPLVVTTHGGFFHTSAHSRIKKIWFNTITRLSALAYRRIIGCSKADKRLFDRIAVSRTVLIENGAGTEKFVNTASLVAKRRMITIGRFSANKQIGNLLEAVKVLSGRNDEWHLDICGVPSDLTEADISGKIEELQIGENVTLHIGASNGDICKLMNNASLFVSASDYEGFGLVAVEAMSAGLLPVLQPNSAYRDLAIAHSFIRLADYFHPNEAAAALSEAYEALNAKGSELRTETISAASAYSWEKVVGRYIDVYKTVL